MAGKRELYLQTEPQGITPWKVGGDLKKNKLCFTYYGRLGWVLA